MRIGLLSDIHANRVALEAVLDDMPDVDALLCAGDVVGYNPWPAACVEVLRERDVPTVMGNHDRMVASERNFGANGMAQAGVAHARSRLDADARRWIGSLPRERVACDGRVKVVHDHPERIDHYTYPREFSPALLGDEEVLVLGHTHVQGYRAFEAGLVVNPGSVGQPRDGDPRAAYAVLDMDEKTIEERRVEYDVERVVDAVAEAGLPDGTGSRLREGR
ncbi:metallophosphoesterase family protein [Halarchaeum nitratireducens]|uniref:Phosphoesterase n=1 Tax=Halarchaeum nitratireducens TaxID=489913 RepID=A0A830GHJ1_9EURY|nr:MULTISPECIES: metallophosphoesterase family protein [Halarchaeum]MBP2252877.1 putative phosphoesterase [Halarchaeum solikamskense]GGN26706.1 DNA repair protein [Halarchaeum nitratireducens]